MAYQSRPLPPLPLCVKCKKNPAFKTVLNKENQPITVCQTCINPFEDARFRDKLRGPPNFSHLDNDVLRHTLTFASPQDIVRFGQIRKAYQPLAHDDRLWQNLLRNDFGVDYDEKHEVRTPESIYKSLDCQIITAGDAVFFIKNRRLYACGNKNGQLGIGNYQDQSAPKPVTILGKHIRDIITNDHSTYFICADNSVYACGKLHNQDRPLCLPVNFPPAPSISSSASSSSSSSSASSECVIL